MDLDNFIDPVSGVKLHSSDGSLVGPDFAYAIVEGIPRFVNSDNYSRAFGLQWNKFRCSQLDSYTRTTITEDRLREAFGEPLERLKGKRVLEAGCGAGRFTEILLKYGAVVYAFDYSEAVEANAANNWPNRNLTIYQGNILSIPHVNDFFDVVVCLGVLQHTPSTRDSIKELSRVLRVGGTIVCDHYKWHLGTFTSLYLPWWFLIKQFNPHRQMRITEALTRFFFPIHWFFRESKPAQLLLRRISPINFYYGRFDLPKNTLFEWSRLDTHDRNTDHFKRHVTRAHFNDVLSTAGLENVSVEPGGTGYVGRATKR